MYGDDLLLSAAASGSVADAPSAVRARRCRRRSVRCPRSRGAPGCTSLPADEALLRPSSPRGPLQKQTQ